MKILTVLTFSLFFLFFPIVTLANDSRSPCSGKTTPLSEEELFGAITSAQKVYGSIKGFTASFSQTAILSALNAEEQSKGIVSFLAPGKLRFDYKEPDAQIFVLNGNNVQFYQEFDQQMVVEKVEDVLISELPIAFLAGVGDLRSSFQPVSGCKRSADIALTMHPKDKKDQNLKSFTLLISPKTYRPKGAYIVDISGNTNYIALSNIKDLPLPNEGLFDFTPPKGTDIITK
jgi:outer membrane lipoprotein carrier protein